MFFDDLNNIELLAQKTGFSIFVLNHIPKELTHESQNRFVISPDESGQIKIEKVREIIEKTKSRQTTDFFVYIINAETLNEKAENAFLKLLEEPAENYHFVMLTNSPSSLLPTILSRGDLYIQRINNALEQQIDADETIKKYAKRIISAKNSELSAIVDNILSEKEAKKNSRKYVLSICETAIEILYKSFFATNNPAFLKKLPKLITTYDNLKQNGHIKLHLIADLC